MTFSNTSDDSTPVLDEQSSDWAIEQSRFPEGSRTDGTQALNTWPLLPEIFSFSSALRVSTIRLACSSSSLRSNAVW